MSDLATLLPSIEEQVVDAWDPKKNSDIPSWNKAFEKLPEVQPNSIDLNAPAIRIGDGKELTDSQREQLKPVLMAFHPWRKGPFDLFGLKIDTEWRSDTKWERLEGKIAPLKGRNVLDIGCGSGYHCWRMLGQGAKQVIGIEPALIYVMQFKIMQKYIQTPNILVLPMGVQHLPQNIEAFDSVFSMGLLYHRRDPLEHLEQLKSFLRPGGELILESLIIEGAQDEILKPKERYAQMRNVWNIPSLPTLETWLKQAGFNRVQCVDVTKTTGEEQRQTEWMIFQSLADFLDPEDANKTIEGYPAPTRAIFIAEKP